jgi:hypothetical protein
VAAFLCDFSEGGGSATTGLGQGDKGEGVARVRFERGDGSPRGGGGGLLNPWRRRTKEVGSSVSGATWRRKGGSGP